MTFLSRCTLMVLFAASIAPARAQDAPAAAPPAAGETYEIRLTRPDKVGLKFAFTSEAALIRKTTLTVGDETKPGDEFGVGIKLEGSAEVLEVRPDGRASKMAITVQKCTGVTGQEAQEKELIPAGKVVVAKGKADGTDYTLQDGGELSPQVAAALELIVPMEADEDDHADDEVFGSKERQAVGAQWPVNAKLAALDARNEGVNVPDDGLAGSMKLIGVEQVEGNQCLALEGRMDVSKLTPPPAAEAGLPEGLKPTGGTIGYRFRVLMPVDASIGSLSESSSARFTSEYAGQLGDNAPEVKVRTETQRAVQISRRFVKQ